ncbi:anaerobic sulfite reductase subunit AsrB [Vibrio harveyi]|uniref:anaerobic sulfite reductase subunit AsrB n=1 Tax=Vibrio harveyi TaxID=669 RepID=UPI000682018B|nr:anaerobic sulfite reductase subunit AsrB [Vibrio harveyi]WVM78950.1 anaerobic sulfite reductase subunit AsrB [Vibrio harveyi]
MCDCENKMLPQSYPIIHIEKHTELEWNFRVACDFPVHYGQFVEVGLSLVGEAPISVSDYGLGYVDLLIRNVGKVTSELFQLNASDRVMMRGAMGNGYPMEEYQDKHLIVVAGGTGVAPVKGLINYFHNNPSDVKKMSLILGFKNQDAVLYKNDLLNWSYSNHVITTLDDGGDEHFYESGLVTEHISKLDLSDKENIRVIVVGPPIMIKFVVQDFLSRGIQEDQIWVDYERRMACSVGKCGHCRIGDKYVCLDGPVFRYDHARAMID